MNLEKLTPSPRIPRVDDAEFIALARNAFDVMMRRKWYPMLDGSGKWRAEYQESDYLTRNWVNSEADFSFNDPFTALVEADAWYATREH